MRALLNEEDKGEELDVYYHEVIVYFKYRLNGAIVSNESRKKNMLNKLKRKMRKVATVILKRHLLNEMTIAAVRKTQKRQTKITKIKIV